MTVLEITAKAKSVAEKQFGKTIKVGRRRYRRFMPYPGPVTDDTCRCIRCGQIDEPGLHISEACQFFAAECERIANQEQAA